MTAVAPRELASTAPPAPGCATVARTLGETPEGTATPMRSWVLIEHPEAWARDVADTVLRAAFPGDRLRGLAELRRRHGLRPLLIRRAGYRAGSPARRTVLVGGTQRRPALAGAGRDRRPAGAGRPRPGRGRRGARRPRDAGHRTGLRRLHPRQQGHVLRHPGPAGGQGAGRRRARAGLGDHPPRRRPVRRQRAGAARRLPLRARHRDLRPQAGRGRRRRPGAAGAAARPYVGGDAGAGRRDRGPPGHRAARAGRRRAGRRGRDRAGDRAGRREPPGRPARAAPLGVCGTSRCAGPSTPCGYSVDELVELPAAVPA